MRAMSLLYAGFIGFAVISAGVFGWSTKQSFQDDTQLQPYLSQKTPIGVSFEDDERYLNQYFDNHLRTLSQLKQHSDIVVMACVTSHRVNTMKAVESQVQVVKVFQGSHVYVGDNLVVDEPSSFLPADYFVTGGWNLMREGEPYVLFLRHLPIPKGYHYKGNESRTYLPVSSYFGKFPVKKGVHGRVLSEAEVTIGVPFAAVRDFDVITADRNIFHTYSTLKAAVKEMSEPS